jgi:hypothetical protein
MKTSESIINITKALLSVQNEFMVISHDKKGFTNTYASYESMIAKAKPILTKAGLLVMQPLDHIDGETIIETWLIHSESGEYFKSTSFIKLMSGQKLQEAQLLGGGISYTKRYALSAILSWATGEIDIDQTTLDDSESELLEIKKEIQAVTKIPDLGKFYTEHKSSKHVKEIIKECAVRKEILVKEATDGDN